MMTTGMPLSMHVTSMPSKRSMRCPVGNSDPHTEPAVSRKLMLIGAAVPGTPSIRASPAYSTRPPGVCTSMSLKVPVLRVNTRKVVRSPVGLTRPISNPNGATAASMLPQLGVVSTRASLIETCANKEFEVHAGLLSATHDTDLARQRIGAAEAVDLPFVG